MNYAKNGRKTGYKIERVITKQLLVEGATVDDRNTMARQRESAENLEQLYKLKTRKKFHVIVWKGRRKKLCVSEQFTETATKKNFSPLHAKCKGRRRLWAGRNIFVTGARHLLQAPRLSSKTKRPSSVKRRRKSACFVFCECCVKAFASFLFATDIFEEERELLENGGAGATVQKVDQRSGPVCVECTRDDTLIIREPLQQIRWATESGSTLIRSGGWQWYVGVFEGFKDNSRVIGMKLSKWSSVLNSLKNEQTFPYVSATPNPTSTKPPSKDQFYRTKTEFYNRKLPE